MTKEALKPCPFCGGVVKLERAADTYDYHMGRREWWGVVCRNTINRGGTCAIEQRPSASTEAAIERWNLRTPPQPEQEPVATDWERIARVQDAKLRAMCNEAGGFEKLCEVMDKYEQTTPPQRKPLTDEEIQNILPDDGTPMSLGEAFVKFARAIEAAHGIKGEA